MRGKSLPGHSRRWVTLLDPLFLGSRVEVVVPWRGARSAGIVFAMRNELDYSAVWLGQLFAFVVAWSAIVRRVLVSRRNPCHVFLITA